MSRALRLAFLGNFRPRDSTCPHWKWAFEKLGVRVIAVQQDRSNALSWERAAARCDIATAATTWGWATPASEEIWGRLRDRGVRCYTAHLDLVVGLPRESMLDDRHPQFHGPEIVWTSDGGNDAVWERHGIDHRWLPPAIHRPDARIGRARPEWECDVVFAGSCLHYHPEWPRRRELVEAARARWGDRFRTFGADWENPVRGPDLADVYASAKVVLGDSLCLGGTRDLYVSDRVTETAGRGGVLVHPVNRASDYLAGCAIWSPTWEVRDQLDRIDNILGSSDQWFDDRRQFARQTVLDRHTYTHRAREILEALGFDDRIQEGS